MQQENESINGSRESAPVSSPISSLTPDRRCSVPPVPIGKGGEFANICNSLFSPGGSSPFTPQIQYQISTPLPITNSPVLSDDNPGKSDAPEQALSLSSLIFQYQEILYRYELCLSHLEEAAEEAEALRLENTNLRMANADLARRLSVISPYDQYNESIVSLPDAYTGFPLNLLNDFQRLGLNGSPVPAYHNDLLLTNRSHTQETRTTLPKSISIRSKGYMKLAAGNRSGRNRFSDPPLFTPQKVYVPVEGDEGNKQEKETPTLEFEAYPQGMFKTELCNKWQETGACPYGEQCQFAHGVAELRPVIRHPRYKTEICRMILSGGTCPYGHRCHFRHALSPQDKFLLSPLN